jgi:hypothetical protein
MRDRPLRHCDAEARAQATCIIATVYATVFRLPLFAASFEKMYAVLLNVVPYAMTTSITRTEELSCRVQYKPPHRSMRLHGYPCTNIDPVPRLSS